MKRRTKVGLWCLLLLFAIMAAVGFRKAHKVVKTEETWVALGDSITCGCDEDKKSYVDYIVQEHPELTCYKKGVIGYRMVDLYQNRERMLKDVSDQRVTVVTVFAGSNDFGKDVSLEEFEENCDSYMKYLKETFPDARVIFFTPMYRDYFGKNFEDSMVTGTVNHLGLSLYAYVDCMKELGEKNLVEVVDLSGEDVLNAENLRKMTDDGLHPNKKGNQRLLEIFEEKVVR